MPLSIDLQVMATKALEHSENIARQVNAAQTGQIAGYEKLHQESRENDSTVQKMEEYSQDFTKIQGEAEKKKKKGKQQEKKEQKSQDPVHEYKPAPKEEGTGRIIDIID